MERFRQRHRDRRRRGPARRIACHLARFGAGRVLPSSSAATLGGGTARESSSYRCARAIRCPRTSRFRAGGPRYPRRSAELPRRCRRRQRAQPLRADADRAARRSAPLALRATLAVQRVRRGSMHEEIGASTPHGAFIRCSISSDDPVIGWEPGAGYADAYMTLSGYCARAARRRGASAARGCPSSRICFATARASPASRPRDGAIAAGVVVSAQNMWSREIADWTGIDVPLALIAPCRDHARGQRPTLRPICRSSWIGYPPDGIYFRSYAGTAADGRRHRATASRSQAPDTTPGRRAARSHRAHRRECSAGGSPHSPRRASRTRGPASTTSRPTGTRCSGRCRASTGLSRRVRILAAHGFKLSPIVGRLVAPSGAAACPTDLPLAPYSIEARQAAGAHASSSRGSVVRACERSSGS